MKLAVRPYELESTIEGEEFEFDFDRNSLVHLMNQYIDLYKDKEMAVLREYACNALDSHKAAGNKAPIEITLPTPENPTLVIQDYGIGLSHDEILDIYSKYGASTKRDSDEYTGALGLGCKAGLTYTPQFTMVAVKDGIRNTVLISRHENGVKGIVVESIETEEPNGVSIQIPCAHHNKFFVKSRTLFQYWDEGTVLVNGEKPPRFEAQHIVDNLYLRRRVDKYYPKHVVVMGGVPYPFDAADLGWEVGHEHDVVAFVPIGTLEFPPDREGLRDTKGNKAALYRIGQTLLVEMQKKAQSDIDAADSPVVAIRRAFNWSKNLPEKARPKVWTYRGQEMPLHFEAPVISQGVDGEEVRARWTVVPQNNSKLKEHEKRAKVPFATAINAVWFYGFETQFSANHRKRLDIWHNVGYPGANTSMPAHYILCAEKPDMTYLKEEQVFDWEGVRSIKLPQHRSGGGGGGSRMAGSYDCVLPHSFYPYEVKADGINQDEAIFYFVANQTTSKGRWAQKREDKAKPWIKALRNYEPDATVVLLPENRLRRFLEQFPDAEELTSAVATKFRRWSGRLAPESLMALAAFQSGDLVLFEGLKADEIHDPAIRDTLAMITHYDYKSLVSKFEHFAGIGQRLELPRWNNPLKHYPLMTDDTPGMRRFRRRHPDQVVAYLNSTYRLRLDPEGL